MWVACFVKSIEVHFLFSISKNSTSGLLKFPKMFLKTWDNITSCI